MRRTALSIALIFLAASAARAVLPATAPQAPALPMKFTKVPLGNVVRIFSARFGVPFTLEANAKSPVTGDFSGMDAKAAAAEAARQAGLYSIALGKDPSAGFRFSLRPPPDADTQPSSEAPREALAMAVTPAAAPVSPPQPSVAAVASTDQPDLDRIRAHLLQERMKLLETAGSLVP